MCYYTQTAKFMWPTWGPPGSCRPQMGPMMALWTLLSEYVISCSTFSVWANHNGFDRYWVDAYDPAGNGSYMQSHTGLPLTYFNWQSGEPNYLSLEKCAWMSVQDNKWMNDRCTDSMSVMCEHWFLRSLWWNVIHIGTNRQRLWANIVSLSLQWRHNEHDGVSDHQPHDFLLNR